MDYRRQKISTEYPVARVGRVDFEGGEIGGIEITNWNQLSPSVKMQLQNSEWVEFDEILKHDKNAVGLDRVENGVCALLDGHPSLWGKNGLGDVVGNIDNVFIEGSEMFGDIKIPDVGKAGELMASLEAGLRLPTSIGYTNHKGRLSMTDGRYQIEVMDWELRHLAIVPEGADNSTLLSKREKPNFQIRNSFSKKIPKKSLKEKKDGIVDFDFPSQERKINNEEIVMENPKGEVAPEKTIAQEPVQPAPVQSQPESTSNESLVDIHRQLDIFCQRDFVKAKYSDIAGSVAEAYGKPAGVSLSERIKIITDAIAISQGRQDIADGFDGGFSQELSLKEQRKYSYSKALMMASGNAKKDGLEWEVSKAIEQKKPGSLRDNPNAVYTSMSMLRRAEYERTSLTMGTAASVGNFVQETIYADQFTPPHRKIDVLTMLGCTMLSGLMTKGAIPVQATEAASAWTAEAGTRAESNLTAAKRTLEPHRLTTLQSYSYELMATEGNLDVENLMRASAYQSMMDSLNASAINGGTTNEPSGVLATSGLNVLTASTNGDVVNWADIVALWSLLGEDDVSTGMGWRMLVNPVIMAKFMSVRKDAVKATAGNAYTSGTLYLDYIVPRVATHGMFTDISGIEGLSSNHVPKGRTRGNSTTSPIILGYWPDLVCASWDSVQVVVDPFSKAEDGIIRLIISSLHDVAVKRPTSFAVNSHAIQ